MKSIKRFLAGILAVIIVMTSASAVFAGPLSSESVLPPENTSAGISGYYEEQLAKYESMKNRSIHYKFSNVGIYTVKSAKLYVREVGGVAEDGSFIIHPWRCVSDESGIPSVEFVLRGTCVMFAFGFDIMWGTDWPYSGVFWTDVDTPVNDIYISSGGLCRTASLKIKVNDSTVFDDWNLPSHDEWKP